MSRRLYQTSAEYHRLDYLSTQDLEKFVRQYQLSIPPSELEAHVYREELIAELLFGAPESFRNILFSLQPGLHNIPTDLYLTILDELPLKELFRLSTLNQQYRDLPVNQVLLTILLTVKKRGFKYEIIPAIIDYIKENGGGLLFHKTLLSLLKFYWKRVNERELLLLHNLVIQNFMNVDVLSAYFGFIGSRLPLHTFLQFLLTLSPKIRQLYQSNYRYLGQARPVLKIDLNLIENTDIKDLIENWLYPYYLSSDHRLYIPEGSYNMPRKISYASWIVFGGLVPHDLIDFRNQLFEGSLPVTLAQVKRRFLSKGLQPPIKKILSDYLITNQA